MTDTDTRYSTQCNGPGSTTGQNAPGSEPTESSEVRIHVSGTHETQMPLSPTEILPAEDNAGREDHVRWTGDLEKACQKATNLFAGKRSPAGQRHAGGSTKMAFRLIARLEKKTLRFPLADGEYTVGSKRDCDITLKHPSVSRRHALIQVEDSLIRVADLDSRNGTRLGRKRVKNIDLGVGDTISFGAVRVTLEEISDDDAIPAIEIHQEAEKPMTHPRNETTLASGPAEAFTLEHLPRLIASLALQVDSVSRAQSIGHAIFEGLPCTDVRVGPVGLSEEGVLFTAGKEVGPGPLDSPLIVSNTDFEFRIGFTSEAVKQLYSRLVKALVTMVEIPGAGSTSDFGKRSRLSPEAVPLPEPPTVVPSMKTLYEKARRVAPSELPILIIGESGTGKEVVAKFIHQSSSVSDGPFLALNCASLPKDLLESELFGIERGVATGVEARPGKFESAAGGTLFLDEIGDMAPETQAKILRVLQSREVYRLGGRKPTTISCRIVAATNRDLSSMLLEGSFREDLYHRIAGWVVEIPPLRQRRADIPNLAVYFLTRGAARTGLRLRGISRAAVDALGSFSWPGNIRQLEQEMARAVLFLEDDELLDSSRLSDRIRDGKPGGGRGTLARTLERVEADEISMALFRHGSIDAAAENLGLSRATLYRRIKALGIKGPGHQSGEGSGHASLDIGEK